MTPSNIIRAWKDPHYRAGLPASQLAAPPTDGFRVKSGLRAGSGVASNSPRYCGTTH